MILPIDRLVLRHGLHLGWSIARYEIIGGHKKFETEIEACKTEIIEFLKLLKFDNINIDTYEPIELMQKVIRYYSIQSIEKHAAVLLGISFFRMYISRDLTSEKGRIDFENLSYSAIREIDPTIISDKENFYNSLKNSKPFNIPEFLDFLHKFPAAAAIDKSRQNKIELYEFDVAFSFAGENREYIDLTANYLLAKGIKIFYDKYYQVELWGKDLYQHLNTIYSSKAKYCVIFISKDYKNKLWTKLELQSAQARAFSENKEYILPVRFDDTELPGINSTISYIELREFSPFQLSELIVEKIKSN